MINAKKRIAAVDICRGIAMVAIVISHAIVHDSELSIIYKILSAFHVPLFFVLSGYLSKYSKDKKEFIKKKFVRIIVPYVIWGLLFLLPYMLFGDKTALSANDKSAGGLVERILHVFWGNGNNQSLKQNSPLWFLPALFMTEIIMNLRIVHREDKPLATPVIYSILLGISLVFAKAQIPLPFGLRSALVLGIFYYTGILLRRTKIDKNKSRNYLLMSLLVIPGIASALMNEKHVTWMEYEYGSYLFMFIGGLLISIAIFAICFLIRNNRLLEIIGRQTMSILIFHKLFLSLMQILYLKSNLATHGLSLRILIYITMAAASVSASIITGKIIKKIHPLLLGEKR